MAINDGKTVYQMVLLEGLPQCDRFWHRFSVPQAGPVVNSCAFRRSDFSPLPAHCDEGGQGVSFMEATCGRVKACNMSEKCQNASCSR